MRAHARSFAAGEIAPTLFGRVDLTRFQTGVALAENLIAMQHGPLFNRAGTLYINETQNSQKRSALLPFEFNAEQAYMLEFGELYVRIHYQGGSLLKGGLPIGGAVTMANPAVWTLPPAHGLGVGSPVFAQGFGGTFSEKVNGQYLKVSEVVAPNTLTFAYPDGTPVNAAGESITATGTLAPQIELVSPYLEADLPDIHFTQSEDVLTLVHPRHAPRELRRESAFVWTLVVIPFQPNVFYPANVAVAQVGPGGGSPELHTWLVTSISADGFEESLPSAPVSLSVDLGLASTQAKVTWGASTATRFNVYRSVNGVFGYVGQSSDGVTGFVDMNIIPDLTKTPPIVTTSFNVAGEYPGAVMYAEQRRWFAGTDRSPKSFWATRSGTESNLTTSIPPRDDDAIAHTIKNNKGVRIRHLLPMNDPIALTSGVELKLVANGAEALTPTSIRARAQGYTGASNVTPVLTNTSALYAADRGAQIREMRFQWTAQGYETADLSIMVPHLFEGHTVTSMCYTREPNKALWVTLSNGKLLGCTYVPEHQVAGWHQHDVGGEVEWCASIPEGRDDALYLIVKRTVNGRTVRYVERMASRAFADTSDCFFVDCGIKYAGPPASTFSGLRWLEGETVSVLGDGAVFGSFEVVDGRITLEEPVSKASIGLPIRWRMQTLPLMAEAQASAQGTVKNVAAVHARVDHTAHYSVGPDFESLVEAKRRSIEPYGSPPGLFTGEEEIVVLPSWGTDASLCFEGVDPLPFTLVSLTNELEVGD